MLPGWRGETRNRPVQTGGRFDAFRRPVEHPVVRTHPETGRRALYVNPYFTSRVIGMEQKKSVSLLALLNAQATREKNLYRHRWQPGDLVMWDNRSTMHYAVYDYDDTLPRLMHRTTAAGDRPV